MEIRLRLTSNCNLNCEYCFAKEFRASQCGDISFRNFIYLLEMCKKENVTVIKVQGGEPTCHKNFILFSSYFKQYDIKAHLYTNGIFNDKLIETITLCYTSVIINCNQLNDDDLYTISSNIHRLIENNCFVMLGKTLSLKNRDIDEFLLFAMPFKDKVKLRLDICRPEKYYEDGFKDFKAASKVLVSSLIKANIMGFSIELDCCLPPCFFSKSEWILIRKHLRGFWAKCSTIIDIAPDLRVTSCFCGVQFKKLYLRDFDSLTQAQHFAEEIENEMRFVVPSSDECENCIKRKKFVCQGGCIGHKNNNKLRYIDKIQLNKFINNEPLDFCKINYNYMIHLNTDKFDYLSSFGFSTRMLNKILDSKIKNYKSNKKIMDLCILEINKEPENPFIYIYIANQLLQAKKYSVIHNILDLMPNNDNDANNVKSKIIKMMEEYDEKIFD